jgi:hypothetical protein
VRLKSDHILPEWKKTVGIVIKEPNPEEKYIRQVSVLWPWCEETLSEKWLEIVE